MRDSIGSPAINLARPGHPVPAPGSLVRGQTSGPAGIGVADQGRGCPMPRPGGAARRPRLAPELTRTAPLSGSDAIGQRPSISERASVLRASVLRAIVLLVSDVAGPGAETDLLGER
jgi:hypothetical protein